MLVTTQWPLKRAATWPHLSGFVFYGCLESLTELSTLCNSWDTEGWIVNFSILWTHPHARTHAIAIGISLTSVHKGQIDNIPALVQITAWRRPGDKSLSEPIMVSLQRHICVTYPQWVNIIVYLFSIWIIIAKWSLSHRGYKTIPSTLSFILPDSSLKHMLIFIPNRPSKNPPNTV